MSTETKTCKCGATFEVANSEPLMGYDFSWIDSFLMCDECTATANEEADRLNKIADEKVVTEWIDAFRATIADATPPLFRATDPEHPKFNRPAWAAISQWKPTSETPWMGLSGGTGGCKSRIAYMAAKTILERMAAPRAPKRAYDHYRQGVAPSFRFFAAYKFSEKVMEQFSGDDSTKRKARAWLDRTRDVDLVLLDDLGKGKLSPAVSAEVFALIDHRHTNQLPMIWTSNSTPEQIAASMSDDMGGPFAGRINESSKIFKFK